jgi:hypothetical protein
MDARAASALIFRPLMPGLSTSRIAVLRYLCVVAIGLSIGCSSTNQGPLCQPGSLLAACREHCESDGDCLAPARCDAATSTCRRPPIACDPLHDPQPSPTDIDGGQSASGDCGATQECDLVTGTCTPRPGAACMLEFDCRAGEVCSGGSCTPAGSSALCQRDSDCVSPNVCRLILDASSAKLVSLCGSPIGPAEAGARCHDNGECQTGLCLRSGTCFGGCQLGSEASARSDCHGHDGVICGETALVLPGAAGTSKSYSVVSCVLSPPACSSDRDCDASGGSCQILVDPKKPTQLRTGCLPVRGLLRSGAVCQRDGDCASGLCPVVGAGPMRACFAACRSVADCRAMAMLVCKPAPYQLDGVSGSITSCVPGP